MTFRLKKNQCIKKRGVLLRKSRWWENWRKMKHLWHLLALHLHQTDEEQNQSTMSQFVKNHHHQHLLRKITTTTNSPLLDKPHLRKITTTTSSPLLNEHHLLNRKLNLLPWDPESLRWRSPNQQQSNRQTLYIIVVKVFNQIITLIFWYTHAAAEQVERWWWEPNLSWGDASKVGERNGCCACWAEKVCELQPIYLDEFACGMLWIFCLSILAFFDCSLFRSHNDLWNTGVKKLFKGL